MTDKELKKLKRAELYEIILFLQDKEASLQAENEALRGELAYRHKLLMEDSVLRTPTVKLNGAIRELKKAADAYLLCMEEEGRKLLEKRNENR